LPDSLAQLAIKAEKVQIIINEVNKNEHCLYLLLLNQSAQ